MKKSLAAAMEEARKIMATTAGQDLTIWVMDKPGKRSIVTTVDWIRKERILDGWHTVAVITQKKEATQ